MRGQRRTVVPVPARRRLSRDVPVGGGSAPSRSRSRPTNIVRASTTITNLRRATPNAAGRAVRLVQWGAVPYVRRAHIGDYVDDPSGAPITFFTRTTSGETMDTLPTPARRGDTSRVRSGLSRQPDRLRMADGRLSSTVGGSGATRSAATLDSWAFISAPSNLISRYSSSKRATFALTFTRPKNLKLPLHRAADRSSTDGDVTTNGWTSELPRAQCLVQHRAIRTAVGQGYANSRQSRCRSNSEGIATIGRGVPSTARPAGELSGRTSPTALSFSSARSAPALSSVRRHRDSTTTGRHSRASSISAG